MRLIFYIFLVSQLFNSIEIFAEKIKNDLMRYELIAESLSGDTLFVEVSAVKKTNLDSLKNNIILQAEILDLKAAKSGMAKGVVLESKIDKGRGETKSSVGLGLSIASDITRSHGGNIKLGKSRLNGLSVMVFLPF